MKQNKKIAITGGIGSGKSSVAKIIAEQGYTVYSCDEIYKYLLENGLSKKIEEKFKGVLDEKGKLNRKALSKIVFSDKEKLQELTSLTNTEVINYALKQMREAEGISFCEVPLLFENGFENLFDNVIVVQRKLNERIKSVAARDKLSEQEIKARINSQFNYETGDFTKYYVIHNDGNLEQLAANTLLILEKLIISEL